MRKGWFVLIVLCLWGQLGINIYIDHQLTDLKDAYARDTTLAYNAGVRHGIEQAVDSSPDVEALATLFSRYRHADAPNFARWVVSTTPQSTVCHRLCWQAWSCRSHRGGRTHDQTAVRWDLHRYGGAVGGMLSRRQG